MKKTLFLTCIILWHVSLSAQSDSCSNVIKKDSILFSKKSYLLNWAAKKKLYHVAMELNRNPGCRIVVTGYGSDCMTCLIISWDRVYSVIQYLRQAGVDSLRFVFSYAQEGYNPEVVTFRSLLPGEDGPAMTEPPSPCYNYYGIRHKRCKGKPK